MYTERIRNQQPQLKSLWQATSHILAVDGWRGFLRGFGARVLTAVPGTAISWSVYEYFKWRLNVNPSPPSPGSSGPTDRAQNSSTSWLCHRSSEVACASGIMQSHPANSFDDNDGVDN